MKTRQEMDELAFNIRKAIFIGLVSFSVLTICLVIAAAYNNMPWFVGLSILTLVDIVILVTCFIMMDGIKSHYNSSD